METLERTNFGLYRRTRDAEEVKLYQPREFHPTHSAVLVRSASPPHVYHRQAEQVVQLLQSNQTTWILLQHQKTAKRLY